MQQQNIFMKKIWILMAVIVSGPLHAQVTEGTIKYSMELLGGKGGNSTAGNIAARVYFKKDKTLTEMVTPVYSMKTLNDTRGLTVLMDAGGKKTFDKKSREQIDQERKARKNSEPAIVLTREKKNILGYECSKSYIVMPGKGTQGRITLWHTPRIANTTASLGGVTPEMATKIKGTILEMDIEQGPVNSRIRAVEISVKPVPDAVFNLSTAGYKERKRPTIL